MKKATKLIVIIALMLFVVALCAGLVACNGSDAKLRFAAPEGTPALAMLRLAADGEKIGGQDVEYAVVGAPNIVAEMTAEKADIIIMPINAGAAQIVNNGVDYKLVSVAVQGSLYLVGHKDGGAITVEDVKGKRVACIGQNAVPGLVFNFVMKRNGVEVITSGTPGRDQVLVEYADNAQIAAKMYSREQNPVDYIVVGEPAATAQKLNQNNDINAEMDMQAEYARFSSLEGVDNYPQAGLFVRTRLANDAKFMDTLFGALKASKDWVIANPAKVTEVANGINCPGTFPPASIPRCAIDATRLDDVKKAAITEFLKSIAPAVKWNEKADVLFG